MSGNDYDYFDEYPNTFILEAMCPDDMNEKEEKLFGGKKNLEKTDTNSLSLVSLLYIYTGTPPHGYGTQAAKVAETAIRASGFNRKKPENKELKIHWLRIERTHWERSDGPFPFGEVHGNFIVSEVSLMVDNFLVKYCTQIDRCVEKIMQKAMHTNSDILTKGRQTFCPFTNQSTTSAIAYRRMYDFFNENLGEQSYSCLEWIKAAMKCFELDSIKYSTTEKKPYKKRVFNRVTKQKVWTTVYKEVPIRKATKDKKETRKRMMEFSVRFASYIKHKERGKKDRRAIASANMILRMFLYIIEEFHLLLSKEIEGSTISIGGEEKKAKIINNLSNNSLRDGPARKSCQGTEDATKWNECTCPAFLAIMHIMFFDNNRRKLLGLPQVSEMGELFREIANMGNFLMALKEVMLGPGPIVSNDKHYCRVEWVDEQVLTSCNSDTKTFYNAIKSKITEDRKFLRISITMLMGSFNSATTTGGGLPVNHRMNPSHMKVVSLRSSDDTMTKYLADTTENNKLCVEMHRRNLEMVGINLSPDKTFFFNEGYGEYTSWYMDGQFVSQYGVETSSIRPQGKNPYDDFYSVAKSTSTALDTLTINPIGASIRLRLGLDGVRRAWRITRDPNKREDISDDVLMLSDGGRAPWNCMNSQLEETSVKEHFSNREAEKEYLLRIRNPENPFSEEPEEEITFSKEMGTLALTVIETPRNVFSYVRRTNRTVNKESKRMQFDEEKANGTAMEIVHMIDPTTLIEQPRSNVVISEHLTSVLMVRSSIFEIDEDDDLKIRTAVDILRNGVVENEDTIYFEYDSDEL